MKRQKKSRNMPENQQNTLAEDTKDVALESIKWKTTAVPNFASNKTMRYLCCLTVPNDTPRALGWRHSHQAKLTFMQRADWDPDKAYDEDTPTCLYCSIE
jgi:hypothetical protein